MKQYFKIIFATSMPFVVAFFASYLVGSFISVSWDPSGWTLDLREFMAIAGTCFGYALHLKLNNEVVL
jgi:hypothetical protein